MADRKFVSAATQVSKSLRKKVGGFTFLVALAYAVISPTLSSVPPDQATVDLLDALDRGDFTAAQMAFKRGGDVNVSIGGRPAYFNFIRHDRIAQLEFVLVRGADLGMRSFMGRTPLHEAALWGRVEISQLLLKHGAEACLTNSRGETPLFYATEGLLAGPQRTEDHAAVAAMLRAHGCTVLKMPLP